MTPNTWTERALLEPEGFRCQAGGLPAISRWLSEARATPPERSDETQCIPEGCQRETGVRARFQGGQIGDGLRSRRDRMRDGRAIRGWCSCLAQPPANGSHPFGMARVAQAGGLEAAQTGSLEAAQTGGLEAISRRLSEARATPPVAGRMMTRIPEGCQRRIALAARADKHLKRMGAVWK